MGGSFVVGPIADVILGVSWRPPQSRWYRADVVTTLQPTDFQQLQDLKMLVPMLSVDRSIEVPLRFGRSGP
jgi:hypothetical protein